MRAMLSFFALFLLVACGGDDDGLAGPDTSHVGTYTLQAINGNPLPAVLGRTGAARVELLAGRITLNADQTVGDSYTLRLTRDAKTLEKTETDAGTGTRSGDAITLRWNSGAVETAALSGNTLTLTGSGFVGVFRK